MLLYNSLGRRKEEFRPVQPGSARMYVCGITAYDYCHLGHARAAVVFDVLARHLRLSGLEVLYIRNFTDIDDKILARAQKEGRPWREVAQTYIQAFHEDMDKLGVERPDLEPRATQFISEIQDICKRLIDRNLAYATASGDVYFRVRAYKPYGRLSERSLDDLQAGARVAPGEEKEDPLDFALWKAAKPGEPAWPSPWGEGRPGWHIECSAMNQPYLPLDIHGGGQDLIFPHHENEIAQSEAAFDKELARFWVHNGFVRVNSEKMSKSLGNFETIRAILENWLPETLRFFLLTKHYRSPLDFTGDSMEEAEKGQRRIYAALRDSKKAVERGKWKNSPFPTEIAAEWKDLQEAYRQAMDDDLNTAQALGQIFSSARLANRLLEDKKLRQSSEAGLILEEFLERARHWQAELGLFGRDPDEFLGELRNMRAKRLNVDLDWMRNKLHAREDVRLRKDFAASDQLRQELLARGITVRDSPQGQEWDID